MIWISSRSQPVFPSKVFRHFLSRDLIFMFSGAVPLRSVRAWLSPCLCCSRAVLSNRPHENGLRTQTGLFHGIACRAHGIAGVVAIGVGVVFLALGSIKRAQLRSYVHRAFPDAAAATEPA